MKIAIIDLGTNTFNLLIRDYDSQQTLINTKIAVKLGEGGLNHNHIAPAAFERGLEALRSHRETILNSRFPDIRVYAFATSAIRSADNGREFVSRAKELYNVQVNVIDGQKEAELIYLGVRQALELGSDQASLIMDIGGGSTEFILANAQKAFWMESFDIGASRLLEKYRPTDPIKAQEILDIEEYLEEKLTPLTEACKTYPPSVLIGSSGSFDTLAAMINEAFEEAHYREEDTSYEFQLSHYKAIAEKMIQSDLKQRLETPGMIPMRADMIVMACVQINFILKTLGLKNLKLSTYALKEGVFYTLNDNNTAWQRSLL